MAEPDYIDAEFTVIGEKPPPITPADVIFKVVIPGVHLAFGLCVAFACAWLHPKLSALVGVLLFNGS